jgi:hypothetical protein
MTATFYDQHLSAGLSQLPGTGGSHRATTDDYDVVTGHWAPVKLFET